MMDNFIPDLYLVLLSLNALNLKSICSEFQIYLPIHPHQYVITINLQCTSHRALKTIHQHKIQLYSRSFQTLILRRIIHNA